MEGRVLQGKSAGGLSYGYAMVRKFDGNGQPIRGERTINEDEAKIVRQIFADYLKGKSPRKIAHDLNAAGIPGPRGSEWAASTINGNRKRGTGILNNEIYVGILVWDRQKFSKDPSTGKRVARPNDAAMAKRVDVPELRIIDQDVWEKVRAYQGSLDRKLSMGDKRRPPKLFSHLLKCGCCGGGMSIVAQGRYGCSTARNKGTCDNRLTVMETDIEKRVLHALKNRLMQKDLCDAFCRKYTEYLNQTRMAHNAARAENVAELEKVERGIRKLIQSIKDGVPGSVLKDEAIMLEQRKADLTRALDETQESPVLIHPNMAHRYSIHVQNLIASLNDPERRDESAQMVRKLIDRIVFTPNDDRSALVIDLMGHLAGILLMSDQKKPGNLCNNMADLSAAQMAEIEQVKEVAGSLNDHCPPVGAGSKVSLVAGVGFKFIAHDIKK